MGNRLEPAKSPRRNGLRTLGERLGPCPWGPVSSLLIEGERYWEIQSVDRPPGLNQSDLLEVAHRLARIDQHSPRFPQVFESKRVGGQTQVIVHAVGGTSLVHSLSPGSYSIQGWAFVLREMLHALQEMQYVGLAHTRIDTHSFRRQEDGRVVLDFFQPLAFAELPGESAKVYSLKSPERDRKINFPVGLQSDLFAVGQLAKTMLERGLDPKALRDDSRIEPARRLLARLSATDPQDRYAHPESALQDLESIATPRRSQQISLDLLRREPLPKQLALIGKEPERYRLSQAWTRTLAGQADPLLVVGQARCGRSELLLHQHRELLISGYASIFLDPNLWRSSGFVGALLNAIDSRCAVRNESSKLKSLIEGELEVLGQVSPALRKRFNLPQSEPQPDSEIRVTTPCLQTMLGGLGPLAIFVDDVDQCDANTQELMRALIEATSHQKVLWVLSARKTLPFWGRICPGQDKGAKAQTLSLALPNYEQNKAILRQFLGISTLPPGLCEWLGLSAEHPNILTLDSVHRALCEGVLYRQSNVWQLRTSARRDPSKDGLKPLILGTAGLGKAPTPSRTLLLRAAALGPGVTLDPLLEILAPDKDGARWLEYAVRMGAVVCYSDGAHRLAHQDFIPKLLDPLTSRQRSKIHNDLFIALSRVSNPKSIPNWPELYAEQGFRAKLHSGQRQRIILDAIERALSRLDQAALQRWYQRWEARAPEPIENIEDHFILSEAALRIGNPIKAYQALEFALETASSTHERAVVKLRITKLKFAVNDPDQAAQHAQQALALLTRSPRLDASAQKETSGLKIRLLMCLCMAYLYSAPTRLMAWPLLQIWVSGATRVSPAIALQFNFMLRVFIMRSAPRWLARTIEGRLVQRQAQILEGAPHMRGPLRIQSLRNDAVVSIFGDRPVDTFHAFNRWGATAAPREDPMLARSVVVGMRMIFATQGAYAIARDAVAQLPLSDDYPEQAAVPSALSCSRYNTQLALGDPMPPRVPIAFLHAPRGTQVSLMALEIERLCLIGELAAAQHVAQNMEQLVQKAPLLGLPVPLQLAYVSLAYGLLRTMLAGPCSDAQLDAVKRLRKQIGRHRASAPSHHRVLGAFLHFFRGRHSSALAAFSRAETMATTQRALSALHWIERGRAHVALARKESSNRIAKLARGAMYYAEQMPCPLLANQIRDEFGEHLRSARVWTGQPSSAANTPSPVKDPSNNALELRFEAFHRSLAKSGQQGSSVFAFLDALVQGTQAKRAAVFRVGPDACAELLTARDRHGVEIDTNFEYDTKLVDRCIEGRTLQNYGSEAQSSTEIRSAMAAPYFDGSAVCGVIYLDDPTCHYRFSASDRAFLTALTPQLPLLVENARLAHTSKRHGIEVQDLQARSEHIAHALALSEAKREQLLTYVHDPVILIGADHAEILELSASAKELLGDKRNNLVGMHYTELFPSQAAPLHRETLAQAVKVGKASLMDESLEFPDREAIPVHVHLRRIDFGALRAVQATFEDLRERNRLQAQLRKAQKVEAMGTLASGIAHDFNNFLGAIGTVAQDLPNLARQKGLILETVQQASQLTSQLLDLTRDRGSRPTAVNLHEHVTRVMRLVSPSLGSNVHCQVDLPDDGGLVYIDPSELTQIVLNLAVNAGDAMPDGGQLQIRAQRIEPRDQRWELFEGLDSRPYRVLAFQDNGSGIPEALLPQIFESFFTTKSEGNGLGLATVHELVTRNHGAISVKSQVYRGTTFLVALPELDASRGITRPGLPAAPSTRPKSLALSNDKVILYVEDEPKIEALITRALKNSGLRVKSFHCSIQALQWYDEHQPELGMLLTDVHLPRLSGIELYEALRSQVPELSVLYLSGASPHELQNALNQGNPRVQLLQKPFSTTRLIEQVHQSIAQAPN